MAQRMPSLALVLDLLGNERGRQLSHLQATDTKAGLLFGFTGVLVALASSDSPWTLVPGVLVAAASASCAVLTLCPRGFPVLNAMRLRQYLSSEERLSQLALVDTTVAMIEQADHLLASKARFLKVSFVLLACAVVLLGVGVSLEAVR